MALHSADLQPMHDSSHVWLPGIVACIARFISDNEIACTLRLVDKATSQQFSDFKTVRVSLPSPTHAFRERWGQPGSFRGCTRKQRLQLLCFTAASGCIANLEVVMNNANAGLAVTTELLEAAAASGQLDVCMLLRERGCARWGRALAEAARGGHRHVCEWLLASGCPFHDQVLHAAACGGHEALMHWLVPQLDRDLSGEDVRELMAAAAEGLSMGALQQLHQQLTVRQQQEQQQQVEGGDAQQQPADDVPQQDQRRGSILAAAARSPTPDWQAKVVWLEGLGYPRTAEACERATVCSDGDAVARLQWLCSRGYTLSRRAASTAAAHGNLAALRFLVEQAGVRLADDWPGAYTTAHNGQLAVLQYLHARGWAVPHILVARAAARGGRLPVVAWAVEALGVTPGNAAGLLDWAAESGSTALLTWLRERGWCWGQEAIANAAEGGCEEALEWLVERGCPWPVDGAAYMPAATNGDLATLRCLHRLGCPWGPRPGALLVQCIRRKPPVPALRCMVELGCSMDADAEFLLAEHYGAALLDQWPAEERLQLRQ